MDATGGQLIEIQQLGAALPKVKGFVYKWGISVRSVRINGDSQQGLSVILICWLLEAAEILHWGLKATAV